MHSVKRDPFSPSKTQGYLIFLSYILLHLTK